MKFEIDPNELTTDQRAHVVAFITNWPDAGGEALKNFRPQYHIVPTEEQRLDAEQNSDLRDISGLKEIRESSEVNLNVIFGTPTATERLELGAKIDSLVPLDSQGLPWDSRIHSSSKATIADGSWKLRRGVDPAEVEKVKAQLKELMAVPAVRSVPNEVALQVLSDNKIEIPVPPAPVIIPQLAEIVPPISGNVGVPPAPKSHYLIDQQPPTTVTLTDLIGRMSKAIAENRLTQAAVKEMCVKHGVSEFHLLGNRPDLLPLIDADMKAMGV